jgi:DNA recombination protein RmuC
MEIFIISGFFTLLLLAILGFWQLTRNQERRWNALETRLSGNNQAIDVLTEWLHEMRKSIDRQTSTLSRQFENTTEVIHNRLENTSRIMNTLNRELGQIQEIGRQIQKFQDFIQSPKLRGNIGEQILNDLLGQVLPRTHFSLQHRFKNGLLVDAIVQTDKGLIPIDSKFPLSAFRQFQEAKDPKLRQKSGALFANDLKKHIDSVSSKYILPEEGTVDFALIYIPSEVVYYEILQMGDQIAQYASQKHVLMVSPNSFYYFLKIILVAMEGKRIETAGRKILGILNGLRQDGQRLTEQLRILNSHLNNSRNALDRVNHESQQLCDRLENTKYLDFEATEPPPADA